MLGIVGMLVVVVVMVRKGVHGLGDAGCRRLLSFPMDGSRTPSVLLVVVLGRITRKRGDSCDWHAKLG